MANKRGHVVPRTRVELEAKFDAIARSHGMTRRDAVRALKSGKLHGRVAEMQLEPLRFTLGW